MPVRTLQRFDFDRTKNATPIRNDGSDITTSTSILYYNMNAINACQSVQTNISVAASTPPEGTSVVSSKPRPPIRKLAVKRYIDKIAPIPVGQENITLYAEGCYLRTTFGETGDMLAYWLSEINSAKCTPPLSEDEIIAIARHVDDGAKVEESQPQTTLKLFASLSQNCADVFNTSFATKATMISGDNELEFFRCDCTPIKFKGGRCNGANFEYATAIPFDIDNDDPSNPTKWDDSSVWIYPDQLVSSLKEKRINFTVVASRNHWLPKEKDDVTRASRPKYHAYLPLSAPLYDKDKYVRYCEWCVSTFDSDTQVKSPAQKIFGYGDNPTPFVHSWNEGRCVDEVLTDTDLTPTVEQPIPEMFPKAVMAPPVYSPYKEDATFRQFAESGEWRKYLGDLEALGWRFPNEHDEQLFFQTPDGDHATGKQDGNIKAGVVYFFSRAPVPFENNKGYSICQFFAGALFGDIGKEGLAKFAKRYLSDSMAGWQPCPVEVFSEKTRRFIQEAARSIGIDPAFIAPLVLSVYAGLIGRCCQIQLKEGYRELSSIWTLLIAASGTCKTAAHRVVLAPIREYQQVWDEEYKTALLEYNAKLHHHHRQSKKDADSPIEKLVAPIPKEILIDDITTESVAEVLEHNPCGCLLCPDELSGFLGGFDAYRTGGQKDLPFWLSVFNGTPIRSNRKSGKKLISVPTPAVSICGGIQPGMIRKILSKNEHFFDAGLIARFLAVNPPDVQEKWTEDVVSQDVGNGYRYIIRRLIGMRSVIHSRPEHPTVVVLSDEAKKLWEVFYNANGAERHVIDDEVGRATWAKLPAYAAKIALVLHIIEHLEVEGTQYDIPTQVSAKTLDAAIRLVDWFKGEAMRVLSMCRGRSCNVDREATAILDAIGKKGKVSKADLHSLRAFRQHPKPSEAIDAKLAELRNQGRIKSYFEKNPAGGRGKECFRLTSDSGTYENSGEYEGSAATVSDNTFTTVQAED